MPHKTKYGNILAGLIAVIIGASFYFKNDIADKVVLHIGKTTITEYELEKNLETFLSEFNRQNGRAPSSSDIRNWIDRFVDRAYFLADAYDKGYDTLYDVNKWVYSMERYVVSKKDGLLDEKLDSASFPDQQEMQAALIKNSRRVYVSYLKFRDYHSALDFLKGNVEIKDREQFDETFGKGSSNNITTGIDKIEWPFLRRGEREEFVLAMTKDQISPILSLSDGAYIVRADSIENVDINQLPDSLKNRVSQVLKTWKKQKRQTGYSNEVKMQAQININPEMLSGFKNYFKNKPVGEFDKNDLATVLSRTLFTYHMANTLTEIPVSRFVEYYNTLPIRKVIRDEEGLKFYIEAMVYDEYAFKKAGQLGITREPRFMLDKENYKKNVMWAAYENKELKKGITVSGDELIDKYEELKNSFTEPTDVTVSVYGFVDKMAASAAAMNIKSKRMELQNLKSETLYLHASINYKNDFLSDSIKAAVFSAKVSEVMMPSYFNGKFVVVIKESEAGKRIKTLPEVKSEVIKKIENEKLEYKKQIYLKRLKTIYPVRNEIEYQKYLGISKTM